MNSPTVQTSIPKAGPFDPDEIIRLWILRLAAHYMASSSTLSAGGLLTPVARYRRTGRSSPRWSEELIDDIVAVTGVAQPEAGASKAEVQRKVRQQIERRIRGYEKKLRHLSWIEALDPIVQRNLTAVRQLLGLNDTELHCLAFILMVTGHEHLNTTTEILGCQVDDRQATGAVAAAVGLPFCTVDEALSGKSRLMGSQLIRRDRNSLRLSDKFDWATKAFPQQMLQPDFDPLKALRDRIVPAPAPTLAWAQFAHLGDLRQVALGYVRQALATKKFGVNILLHGEPGVGKSEFTRALAKELGCELFEVSTEDEDGNPVEPVARLQSLRVLHGFCASRHCLVAFDECEDVFPRPHPLFGVLARNNKPKGWLNRMLENNPSITLWLANCVEGIDSAFVRRFDLVIEIRNPPMAVRETQLRHLPVSLPESFISKMAACANLTPAVVHRAAAVVGSIQAEFQADRVPRVMEMVVNQTLQAQGHAQIRASHAADAVYSPAYINTDFDPMALAVGIRGAKAARLCLYGPPGTGKTAFGLWLVRNLGRQILMKRASDLLSPYIGVAEKNIAKAFREAAETKAVLLIDEVDSFLQERGKAHRSWEVTQVNEFLTQMEEFEGIFIATTNLVEGLDAASLRRFDLKTQFGYLKPVQASGLLAAHLLATGLPPAGPGELRQLETLLNLTPGDFAAVARQHRFRPLMSAEAWITSLQAEVRLKTGSPRQVLGFGVLSKAS